MEGMATNQKFYEERSNVTEKVASDALNIFPDQLIKCSASSVTFLSHYLPRKTFKVITCLSI